MGKTYKIIVCGKKATGKTTILEQLIYNNANIPANTSTNTTSSNRPTSINNSLASSTTTLAAIGGGSSSNSNSPDKYFSTIEDIYVACWEKDKGVKEKLRFYDTRGMDSSKDTDTINQMRHLFPLVDGCVLLFSSNDSDSMQCIEKLKFEIEKSKDKKDICHFIIIDNQMPVPVNTQPINDASSTISSMITNRDLIRQEMQTRLRANLYEFTTIDKRDLLCKPFIDLAMSITQVNTKGSMNIVQSIKKPKVFSSNK